jgi:hypothetical protein
VCRVSTGVTVDPEDIAQQCPTPILSGGSTNYPGASAIAINLEV